jgi:hypothetical protein
VRQDRSMVRVYVALGFVLENLSRQKIHEIIS